MQGKPSRRTWQYPRCAGEAIAAYMALSKEGGGEKRGGRKEEGAEGTNFKPVIQKIAERDPDTTLQTLAMDILKVW